MDRRTALKKLGVGGAVSISAPVLLDSFKVAHAASGSLPTDQQVRGSTVASISDKKGPVTITLDTGEFPPGTTFSWALVTTNPPHQIVSTAGSSVQVKKASGNINSFEINVTAAMANGGPVQTYRLGWNKGNPYVVS